MNAVIWIQRLLLLCAALNITPAIASAAEGATSSSQSRTTGSRALITPPRRETPGLITTMPLGMLYVPAFYSARESTGTRVVVFFHGAAWCAQQNFWDAHKNAVLVSVSMPMGAYESTFRNGTTFTLLLNETKEFLVKTGITSAPISEIYLASFSGGCPAVREVLRSGVDHELIRGVALADSLYASRVPGTEDRLSPEAMAPFLDFAGAAATESGKVFVFSHLFPPEPKYRGNTTTLAANYLIDHLGLVRRDASSRNSQGAQLLYRADKAGLHILGYAGMTTQDHFNHFYAIADLFRLLPIPEGKAKNAEAH